LLALLVALANVASVITQSVLTPRRCWNQPPKVTRLLLSRVVATPALARNCFGFGEPKWQINVEAGKDSSSFCYCGSPSPRQDVHRESQSARSTTRRARALFNYFNINQQEKNYENHQ